MHIFISCPYCKHSKQIDDAMLPNKSIVATCPKCANNFTFNKVYFHKLGEVYLYYIIISEFIKYQANISRIYEAEAKQSDDNKLIKLVNSFSNITILSSYIDKDYLTISGLTINDKAKLLRKSIETNFVEILSLNIHEVYCLATSIKNIDLNKVLLHIELYIIALYRFIQLYLIENNFYDELIELYKTKDIKEYINEFAISCRGVGLVEDTFSPITVNMSNFVTYFNVEKGNIDKGNNSYSANDVYLNSIDIIGLTEYTIGALKLDVTDCDSFCSEVMKTISETTPIFGSVNIKYIKAHLYSLYDNRISRLSHEMCELIDISKFNYLRNMNEKYLPYALIHILSPTTLSVWTKFDSSETRALSVKLLLYRYTISILEQHGFKGLISKLQAHEEYLNNCIDMLVHKYNERVEAENAIKLIESYDMSIVDNKHIQEDHNSSINSLPATTLKSTIINDIPELTDTTPNKKANMRYNDNHKPLDCASKHETNNDVYAYSNENINNCISTINWMNTSKLFCGIGYWVCFGTVILRKFEDVGSYVLMGIIFLVCGLFANSMSKKYMAALSHLENGR